MAVFANRPPGAHHARMPPIIGITCGLDDKDLRTRRAYADAVCRAGGVPVLLPPPADPSPDVLERVIEGWLRACDGFIFTGGPDADTTPFGQPMHPAAKPVHPDRQRAETALLRALSARAPQTPALGVCLGMQMMSLHAGAGLEQHMPDVLPTADEHMNDAAHAVSAGACDPSAARYAAIIPDGSVTSWHHQAVRDVDRSPLRVVARAHDGTIEAVADPSRRFYLGVQWHPERTPDPALGDGIIRALVQAAG